MAYADLLVPNKINFYSGNHTVMTNNKIIFDNQFKSDRLVLWDDQHDGYRFCGLGIQPYETRWTINNSNSHFSFFRGDIGGNTEIFRVEADLNKGATIFNTAQSTSSSTGALVVKGGVGISGNLNVTGAINSGSMNELHLSSTVDSSSITTGAFTVTGGAGIGSRCNIGGKVIIYDTTNSSISDDGSFSTLGGCAIAKDLRVYGGIYGTINGPSGIFVNPYPAPCIQFSSDNVNFSSISVNPVGTVLEFNKPLHLKNTTGATDSLSGALIVDGGVGISENLNVGGTITAYNLNTTNLVYENVQNVTSTQNSTSTSTGALIVSGGGSISKNLYVGEELRCVSTINSSSITTGSLVVGGGVGIASDLYVGGTLYGGNIPQFDPSAVLNLTDTTLSTSTSSGALTISGGVGVGESLYVEESINVNNGYYRGKIVSDASWWRLYRMASHGNDFVDFSIINKVNNTADLGKTDFYCAAGVGVDMVTKYSKSAPVDTRICTFNVGGLISTYAEVTVDDPSYSTQTITDGNWQSFTAITGYKMIHFAVKFLLLLEPYDFTFGIFEGEGLGGILLDTILVSVTPSQIPEWITVNTTTSITLVPNAKYTLAVTTTGGTTPQWCYGVQYAGGTNDRGSIYDYMFTVTTLQTYVDVCVQGSISDIKINSSGTIQTPVDRGTGTFPSDYPAGANLVFDSSTTAANSNNEMGDLTLNNTTASASTSTGSLLLKGGAGIAKKLYVGDEVHCISTVNSSGVTSGSLIVSGGAGIASNLNVGGALNLVSGISATSTSTGALVISGGLGCSEQVFAYSFTADNSVTSQGLYCTGQLQQFSDAYVKTTTTPQMNIVYGTSLDPNTYKTTMTTDSSGNFSLDCTGGSFETGNLFKVKITTESTSTSTGALQVRGGAGIAKKLYVGGSLSGNDATFTNTTTPLSLNYDVTNKTTFSISSGGDLTIDSTGNDINFHSTDNVHILNTVASTSISTGSLVVSGGAGFAGAIYSGSNFFISPSVNLIKESQLLGAVRTTGGGTDATIVTNGSFAFYSFVNGATRNLYTSWDTAHEYKLGSTITPHIHIFFDNVAAGRVDFQLTYNIAEVDNGFDFTGTNLTTVSQTNDIASPTRHYMLDLGGFTGPTAVGAIVNMRLRRLGTTDTYTQPVYLASWGLHWYTDRLGNLT